MSYKSPEVDRYLAHYGIKGQKWGVRRYQNEDGSLTPEGKAHYSYGDLDISRTNDGKVNVQSKTDSRKRYTMDSETYDKYANSVHDVVRKKISEASGVHLNKVDDLLRSNKEALDEANNIYDEYMHTVLNNVFVVAERYGAYKKR